MAGVLRPQPGIRARSVRTVPTEPGVRRSRDPGAVRDLDASKRGIARARGGVAASEDRRRREPRRVHPALRAPGGQARSSRRTSSGRPVAALGNTRRHGSGSACAAGEPRIRRAGRSRQDGVRRHRGAASDLLFDVRVRLLARVRAGGARVAAAGGRSRAFPRARPIRSTREPCSIGCRRSRRSSVSCSVPSLARPASRSRGSTCSSRCWTR